MTNLTNPVPGTYQSTIYRDLLAQHPNKSAYEFAQWIIDTNEINASLKSVVIEERLKTLKKIPLVLCPL